MKREAYNHAKIKLLARDLGIPLPYARGIVNSVWMVTAVSYPRGDIGRLTNEEIAIAIDYPDDADKLIDSMVKRRLLDESEECRLIVHDWHEHADSYVHAALAKRLVIFANGQPPRIPHEAFDSQARARIKAQFEAKYPGCFREDSGRTPGENGKTPGELPSLPEPVPVPVPEPVPEEKRNSCGEPGSAPTSPPPSPATSTAQEKTKAPRPADGAMEFPVVGKSAFCSWWLCATKLAEYRESFPGVDVAAELKLARQWCIDNPPRRKTESGMPAFLNRWLTKAQNTSHPANGPPQRSQNSQSLLREEAVAALKIRGEN